MSTTALDVLIAARLAEKLLALCNAADDVGVKRLDYDDLPDDVKVLQLATSEARKTLVDFASVCVLPSANELIAALEWIAARYDSAKTTGELAMDAYDMSCVARAAIEKARASQQDAAIARASQPGGVK